MSNKSQAVVLKKAIKKEHSINKAAIKHARDLERAENKLNSPFPRAIDSTIMDTFLPVHRKGMNRKRISRTWQEEKRRFRSMKSLRIEMSKVEKILKRKQYTMMTAAKPFMIKGFTNGFEQKLGDTIKGTDFMNSTELTNLAINRKLKMKIAPDNSDLQKIKELKFTTKYGILKNVKRLDGGFDPRFIGGDYTFYDLEGIPVASSSKNAADTSIEKRIGFPMDFKYQSLIFPFNDTIKEVITQFIRRECGPGNDDLLSTITDEIAALSTPADAFSYLNPASERMFYTADYETLINEMRCRKDFSGNDNEIRISAERKYVVSILNVSNKDNTGPVQSIPICEETTIHVQIKIENTYQNTENFLVLSALPEISGMRECLHVLADNAFSIPFKTPNNSSKDRHAAAMENVGKVIHAINTIHDNMATENPFFEFLTTNKELKAAAEKDIKGALEWRMRNPLKTEYNDKLKQERDKTERTVNELLSASFLKNHIRKNVLETTDNLNYSVEHWVASASFSFIAITLFGDRPKTYGFVQTYDIQPKKTIDTNGTGKPSLTTAEPTSIREEHFDSTQLKPVISPTNRTNQSYKSWSRSPSNRHTVNDHTAKAHSLSDTASTKSQYTSSLPLELELELEELSSIDKWRA